MEAPPPRGAEPTQADELVGGGHEQRSAVEVFGGEAKDRRRDLPDVVRIRKLVDQLPKQGEERSTVSFVTIS